MEDETIEYRVGIFHPLLVAAFSFLILIGLFIAGIVVSIGLLAEGVDNDSNQVHIESSSTS